MRSFSVAFTLCSRVKAFCCTHSTEYTRFTDTCRSAMYRARTCGQQLDGSTGSEQWGDPRPHILVGQLPQFIGVKTALNDPSPVELQQRAHFHVDKGLRPRLQRAS